MAITFAPYGCRPPASRRCLSGRFPTLCLALQLYVAEQLSARVQAPDAKMMGREHGQHYFFLQK